MYNNKLKRTVENNLMLWTFSEKNFYGFDTHAY